MNRAATKHPINPSLQTQGWEGVGCFFARHQHPDALGRLDAVSLGPDGLVDLGDYLWDKPRSIRYSTTTFTHDANGHRTQKTGPQQGTENWVYEYNAQERLSRITKNNIEQATYQYNAQGQRIQKTTNTGTTFYLYNNMGLAAEYDQTGTLQKEYGYLPGQPYMTNPVFQRTSTSFGYYQNDHLGTPQRLIDKQGITVWQASYDAFGKATVNINTVENNLRFAGQYFDSESGLHQNWFRDYDPDTGRYIERDPVGLRGGVNTYGYALQNPVMGMDPWGLKTFCEALLELANLENDIGQEALLKRLLPEKWLPEPAHEIFGGDPSGSGRDQNVYMPSGSQVDFGYVETGYAARKAGFWYAYAGAIIGPLVINTIGELDPYNDLRDPGKGFWKNWLENEKGYLLGGAIGDYNNLSEAYSNVCEGCKNVF